MPDLTPRCYLDIRRRDDGGAAHLLVHTDAAPAAAAPSAEASLAAIHPRLFGNFLEHLGFSIQGGILAQLLLNPTLAPAHHVPHEGSEP